jgi:hypothetical protein
MGIAGGVLAFLLDSFVVRKIRFEQTGGALPSN